MTKPWKRNVAEVHIRTLCRTHHIAIRYVKGRTWLHLSESSEMAQMVHIPHSNNARQYLVALHEIGHLLGPFGVSQRDDHPEIPAASYHLIAEASAWAWAVTHIHSGLDQSIAETDFKATIGTGLVSYCWTMAHAAAHG